MNGWTPTTPLNKRLENLIEQIPQSCRADIVAQCVDENPHTMERNLTGAVLARVWEHPVDEAQRVERELQAQHEEWLDHQRTLEDARF